MIALSLWKGPIKVRISMAQIAADVAEIYGVTEGDIRGRSRKPKYVEARRHAVWLMSQQPHLSFSMIGKFMSGRDHTTMVHHRNRYREIMTAQKLKVAA